MFKMIDTQNCVRDNYFSPNAQNLFNFDDTMNAIPRKLGRYLIVREIGRGAMGVVYKAHDPVIEREVAIKAINLSFQVTQEEKAVYLNRFYREAKAAGKLNHPGIVTIYDVDEDHESSTPFIVMEYLEGITLQDVMASETALSLEQSTNIIMQVAEALSYAHEHGVVHRDVKSANILIFRDSKAKITDFGIARLPSSDLTRSGQFIGTPNYMSPEQITAGRAPLNHRTDIYSLGATLYELLTLQRPFTGERRDQDRAQQRRPERDRREPPLGIYGPRDVRDRSTARSRRDDQRALGMLFAEPPGTVVTAPGV